MRNGLAALLNKLTKTPSDEQEHSIDPRPASNLYECSACHSMIINPASDRCPQCKSGTLARR